MTDEFWSRFCVSLYGHVRSELKLAVKMSVVTIKWYDPSYPSLAANGYCSTVSYSRKWSPPTQRGYNPSRCATTVSRKHIDLSKTRVSITAWRGFYFLATANLKSNVYTAPATQNSHSQNTTAFQPSVILNGIGWLRFTGKGRSAFLTSKHYQGQMQTP